MFFAHRIPAKDGLAGRVLTMLLLGSLLLAPAARADLMLNPTRLVFEKNQRAAQVDLINNGSESATYRIGVVNRRMTETGDLVAADSALPGEQFADHMLVFSPRQVTLAPGTSQTVRVMVRRPAGLPPGEYRSHLHFDKLPDADASTSVEPGAGEPKQIGIVLKVLVGATIPVIVRQGDLGASVTLSHLALQSGARPTLALDIERSGERSVYGDLAVSFTPDAGREVELAHFGGVAVYTPNPVRRARLVLAPPPGLDLRHGSVHVSYRERPDAGGKMIAEARLVLP
jgi:P pilus assembly chaperone PapD